MKSNLCQAVVDGQHRWSIEPETDGLEQRCVHCGERRPTPEEDKYWLKKEKPPEPEKAKEASKLGVYDTTGQLVNLLVGHVKHRGLPIIGIDMVYDILSLCYKVSAKFDIGEYKPLVLIFTLHDHVVEDWDRMRLAEELGNKLIRAYTIELERLADQFIERGE